MDGEGDICENDVADGDVVEEEEEDEENMIGTEAETLRFKEETPAVAVPELA